MSHFISSYFESNEAILVQLKVNKSLSPPTIFCISSINCKMDWNVPIKSIKLLLLHPFWRDLINYFSIARLAKGTFACLPTSTESTSQLGKEEAAKMRGAASPHAKRSLVPTGSLLYSFPLCYEDNFRKHDNIIKQGKDNPVITAAENKTQINVTNAHVKRDNNDAYKWIFSSGARNISAT